MKHSIGVLIFVILCLGLQERALASLSAQIPYEVVQPDGSRFVVVDKGNEWSNRTETLDGFTVALGDNDYWYFVEEIINNIPVLSHITANNTPPDFIKKHLSPGLGGLHSSDSPSDMVPYGVHASSHSNAAGGPILFILAEFSDRLGETTEASWAEMLNENIVDYFTKASHNNAILTPANETSGTQNNGVIDWVNIAYPHPDTADDTSKVNRGITADAIRAANPYVDFASYDANNDGYIDISELAVVVIVAGYERSYSGAYSPSVWAHKWSIADHSAPRVDGVRVGAYHNGAGGYAQFGEFHRSTANDQHQSTMGIIVHELGHLVFGLPDLYDRDDSSDGIGVFGVMGSGNWGRSLTDTYWGETPVMATAWSKLKLGWVDATVGIGTKSIVASGDHSSSRSNTVLRAHGEGDEYFLVENRQPVGYDLGLQRYLGEYFGGLAIWHIDDTQSNNKDDSHRWVDLEEADNNEREDRASDLWTSSNGLVFNNLSAPNSKLYDDRSSSVDIRSSSLSDTVMEVTFGEEDVDPKDSEGPTPISPVADITGLSPNFVWKAVETATQYQLYVDDFTGVRINKLYSSDEVNCSSGYGNCSIKSEVILNSGSVYWAVRSYDGSGYGVWSDTNSFIAFSIL